MTEKRHGDRVALFGEGSEKDPSPRPPGQRPVLRLRALAQPMLRRGGARRGQVPGRGARRTGSSRLASPRAAGVPIGPGGIWVLAIWAAVRRGSHASAAQPRAPCPRPPGRPPHLAKGRPPSGPPAPAGRKVTSAGQRARARGGVWTGSARVLGAVRRRRGRGEEAADAGCLPRLPAPLQEARRLRGAAAGAHSQRRRRERQPRPDSASRLRGRRPPP